MSRELIYNAEIVNEHCRIRGYIVVEGSIIKEVSAGEPSKELMSACDTATDVDGATVIPGVIDDQVHFREPGLTHKAEIATEARAAVAGGVTSFMDMPNTKPPTVSLEALEAKYSRAAEVSPANYAFFIGATNDNLDTLKAVDYTRTPGVKLFLGSSTGNMLVDNKDTLKRIFTEVPALIAIHSEDEALIRRNREFYISRYGDNLPVTYHPLIRSNEACYKSTLRAVEMARRYGTRLHILHLSTAKELELLDACPLSEKRITSEVCVHHLWFTDDDYSRLGNLIKWNPAIKTWQDRGALREAVASGLVDIVATDHAPHLLSEKQGNCLTAASGGPLVQHSLQTMLELVDQKVFTIETVVDAMCHRPAELFHIDRRGYIRKGYYADLVVIDRGVPYTVRQENILSKCGWSPFEGYTFHNTIHRTYVNGVMVYDQGTVNPAPAGERLIFNN